MPRESDSDVPQDDAAQYVPSEDDEPQHAAPRRRRTGSIAVAAVAALAGLLFATNASLFKGDGDRSPTNLEELARAETHRLEHNETNVSALRSQIQDIVDNEATHSDLDPAAAGLTALATGDAPVVGPGIVVELWDAPAPADLAASDLHPDDLVVHQQDIEAVTNAMWEGGAEAMTIQDQRITATSAVRCIGNVLLLHGRHYSPPYRIAAIGDPAALESAVRAAPGVQIYQQYVERVALGWSLNAEEQIEMPAYSGSLRMDYARVPIDYAAAEAN